MRTRQKSLALAEPSSPPLVSVPELVKAATKAADKDDKPKSGRGGARPGSGRKPYLTPNKRKESPAYVSMTDAEKKAVQKRAKKANLTLSFFIRQALGLAIDPPK